LYEISIQIVSVCCKSSTIRKDAMLSPRKSTGDYRTPWPQIVNLTTHPVWFRTIPRYYYRQTTCLHYLCSRIQTTSFVLFLSVSLRRCVRLPFRNHLRFCCRLSLVINAILAIGGSGCDFQTGSSSHKFMPIPGRHKLP
jgi:hypothetical protein